MFGFTFMFKPGVLFSFFFLHSLSLRFDLFAVIIDRRGNFIYPLFYFIIAIIARRTCLALIVYLRNFYLNIVLNVDWIGMR